MSETVKEVEVVQAEPTMSNKKEQLGHAFGAMGHDSAYSVWSTWMTPFLTDVVQMPAVALGVLLLVGRIFDGVNDIFMGSIADRTRSRWGRFRPWIIRAGPLFCVCMALSFLIPSDNMLIRIIYASVMYIVVDVVFTAVDIPFWSLPAAMTSNTKERSGIIGTTMAASNAITGSIGIVMPLALVFFGGASNGSAYFKAAMIVAAFAIVMYLLCFKMVREHVQPDPSQKFSIKLGMKCIFSNKPLLCIQIVNAICLLALIMKGNFGYYYARYNLGNLSVMAVRSTIGIIFGLVGSISFIFLAKRIWKKKIMFLLASGYIVSCVLLYFAGWGSLAVIYCLDALSSICTSGLMVGINAMMADTIEYGEWKTGQRSEGMITATRCFVSKLVAAVSGVFVAFVIGTSGYIPGGEQSIGTLNSFHFILTIGCASIMLLAMIPIFFYTLTEDKHAEIVTELAARKADK